MSDLKEAIKKCFQAWLSHRGTAGALESIRIVEQVKYFIEKHGDARFQPLNPGADYLGRTWPNRAGYREAQDSSVDYYILPEVFRHEVCDGFNYKTACKVLFEAGILKRKESGKYISRVSTKIDGGYPYCYCISFPEPQTE